jgi:hypothetical protein
MTIAASSACSSVMCAQRSSVRRIGSPFFEVIVSDIGCLRASRKHEFGNQKTTKLELKFSSSWHLAASSLRPLASELASCARAFAIRPDDRHQPKLAIFGTDFARDASECVLGASNEERRFLRAAAFSYASFHIPIRCRTELTSLVAEVASAFAGRPRLSQITNASRVADNYQSDEASCGRIGGGYLKLERHVRPDEHARIACATLESQR